MFSFIRQHKIAALVILANIIAVLVVIFAIVYHNAKTAAIDIYVAPIDATIELNGKPYENFMSYDVMPGEYHVKISMDGMQTKEFDFVLENDGFYKIQTYLLDADGGFGYYLDHPEDETILETAAGDDSAARKFIEEYNRIWSIIDVLPLTFSNTYDENATEIVSINIRLGQGEECNEESHCLIISDYTGKNHDKALQMIKDAGYNPDDYEIVFKEGLN